MPVRRLPPVPKPAQPAPQNPLDILRAALSIFERDKTNTKERSVTMWAVYDHVQNQLELEYMAENPTVDLNAVDEEGYLINYCPSYVLDVYLNDKGAFALVTKSDGKLYKIPVMVGKDNTITTEPAIEVFMEALPVVGREFTIKRQADGKYRWFAMPACTAVLNRSGEIDSRALFDSFVDHIVRTQDYPKLDFYHMGENIVLGDADWVGRDGVAYCASGTFHDTPVARAAIKALETDPAYWGISIAYLPTSEPEKLRAADVEIPVYNSGINCFISLLPEVDAASILTSITLTGEVTRMNPKVKEALRKLAGDNLAEEFATKLDSVNRASTSMISRDLAGGAVTPVAEQAEAQLREITSDDITTIVNDPAFEAKVMEIIKKVELTEAETELADAQAAVGEMQTQSRQIKTLTAAVAALSAQVVKMDKERTAAQNVVQEDLPERAQTRATAIVRPRAAITSVSKREKVDMAAIAAETLARQGQA